MKSSTFLRFIAVLTVIVWTTGCDVQSDDAENAVTLSAEQRDSVRKDSVRVVRQTLGEKYTDSLRSVFQRIRYERFPVATKHDLDSIRRRFRKTDSNWVNYRAFTTVNRKDIHYVRMGDTVLIPDTLMEDLRAYSVFPAYYPGADTIPKIVLISNAMQSYGCYEFGKLVRFAAVNSGEERKPTLPGRYAVNWIDRLRKSSLDSTWILPYTVNFHLYAGSAFHQFDMPGRPVSHSCVRQFLADAEWLYKWVDRGAVNKETRRIIPMTGTPILIIDVFDFTRKKGGPWLDLTSNRDIELELPADPMAVEEALIPISQIPHVVRGGLPDKTRYVTAEEIIRERGHIREGVTLRESIDFNKLRRERRAREAKKRAEQERQQSIDSTQR